MSDIYCNVRDFGAKGDGRTDDTDAFKSALAQAGKGHGCVLVPMGRYCIQPIKVPSHTTLFGNAAWGYSAFGYDNNKRLKGKPVDIEMNGNTVIEPLSTEGPALLDLSGSVGTRIIGLSFDGMYRGQNFHCIFCSGGTERLGLVFEDIRISHFTGVGLKLLGVGGFSVRRSLIIKNQSHAIDCSCSEDGSFMDNQLAYNLGAGLYACRENDDGTLSGAKNLLITANRIEGGYPGGIYLWESEGCTVVGNSFDNCRGPAVTLICCTNCALTGNMSRIHGCTQEADENCHYRLESIKGTTVTGNTLWCWYRLLWSRSRDATGPFYGMILKELQNCVVVGNAMHECCSTELIHSIGDSTDFVIKDNIGCVSPLAERRD